MKTRKPESLEQTVLADELIKDSGKTPEEPGQRQGLKQYKRQGFVGNICRFGRGIKKAYLKIDGLEKKLYKKVPGLRQLTCIALAGLIGVGYLLLRRTGEKITDIPDSTIDKTYYRSLIQEFDYTGIRDFSQITDISQIWRIKDILLPVYDEKGKVKKHHRFSSPYRVDLSGTNDLSKIIDFSQIQNLRLPVDKYELPTSRESGMTNITNINQVSDLVSEVYYLTTGREIRKENFLFNIFGDNIHDDDFEKRPFEIKFIELMNYHEISRLISGVNGINLGGKIFVKKTTFLEFFGILFHEIGHSLERKIGKFKSEVNTEKKVIDFFHSLMWLDKDLGYSAYEKFLYPIYGTRLDKEKNKIWNIDPISETSLAKIINQIRCMKKGNLDIENISKRKTEKILDEINKERHEIAYLACMGFLDMFRQRFEGKQGFEEKYAKLQRYFKYGPITKYFDRENPTKEELEARIKEKNDFLQQRDYPDIIRERLLQSKFRYQRTLRDLMHKEKENTPNQR